MPDRPLQFSLHLDGAEDIEPVSEQCEVIFVALLAAGHKMAASTFRTLATLLYRRAHPEGLPPEFPEAIDDPIRVTVLREDTESDPTRRRAELAIVVEATGHLRNSEYLSPAARDVWSRIHGAVQSGLNAVDPGLDTEEGRS